MSDQCRTCGAAIRWIMMESGKRMPVDAQPQRLVTLQEPCRAVESANLRAKAAGQDVASAPTEPRGVMMVCYVPHFATCPQADQHRRPR